MSPLVRTSPFRKQPNPKIAKVESACRNSFATDTLSLTSSHNRILQSTRASPFSPSPLETQRVSRPGVSRSTLVVPGAIYPQALALTNIRRRHAVLQVVDGIRNCDDPRMLEALLGSWDLGFCYLRMDVLWCGQSCRSAFRTLHGIRQGLGSYQDLLSGQCTMRTSRKLL